MDFVCYQKISEYLDFQFEKLFVNKESFISLVNKITFVEKEKFNIFSEELDDYVFDKKEYLNSKNRQNIIKEEILELIENDRLNVLRKFFQMDQSVILKYITRGIDKKSLSREVKFEYLFENSIIRNENNKECLKIIFNEMSENYLNMNNFLSKFIDNTFVNNTNIDINDSQELFEKNNKLQNKMKQDFAFFILFVNNGIISDEKIEDFIKSYLKIFKKLLIVQKKNVLEIETIKLFATGIRYIEVILEAYSISRKIIKRCKLYKKQVNAINPSIRFL